MDEYNYKETLQDSGAQSWEVITPNPGLSDGGSHLICTRDVFLIAAPRADHERIPTTDRTMTILILVLHIHSAVVARGHSLFHHFSDYDVSVSTGNL